MSTTFNYKLELASLQTILARRGLETRGRVQQLVDNEVLKRCDPYVPMRTGRLKGSGPLATTLGSGEVVYNAPYARPQYYKKRVGSATGALRGGYWFERMKAGHLWSILEAAANAAGGKPK